MKSTAKTMALIFSLLASPVMPTSLNAKENVTQPKLSFNIAGRGDLRKIPLAIGVPVKPEKIMVVNTCNQKRCVDLTLKEKFVFRANTVTGAYLIIRHHIAEVGKARRQANEKLTAN